MNETMSRYRFLTAEMGSKSVGEYVTELKLLAQSCNLGDLRDSLIRDKIVTGSSPSVRERLLRDPELTLAKAIQMVQLHQSAEKHSRTLGAESGAAKPEMVYAAVTRHRTPRSERRQSNPEFHGRCWVCKTFGHKASDCEDRHFKPGEDKSHARVSYANVVAAGYQSENETTYASAFLASSLPPKDTEWYVDSASTHHVCRDRGAFADFWSFQKPRSLKVGNGRHVSAYGYGTVYKKLVGTDRPSVLQNVLFAPKFAGNIFSVLAAVGKSAEIRFYGEECDIYTEGLFYTKAARASNGLFVV